MLRSTNSSRLDNDGDDDGGGCVGGGHDDDNHDDGCGDNDDDSDDDGKDECFGVDSADVKGEMKAALERALSR